MADFYHGIVTDGGRRSVKFLPPLPHLVLDSLPPELSLELLRLASRNVEIVPQSCLHELSRLPITQRGFDVFLNMVVNLLSTKQGKKNWCQYECGTTPAPRKHSSMLSACIAFQRVPFFQRE